MAETILFVAANPDSTDRLRLDKELKAIRKAVESMRGLHEYVIHDVQAATIKDLRQALHQCKPRIVHFCGHGAGEQGLYFETDEGESALISTRSLTNLFAEFADHVECVVSNACYSDTQAKAISKKIPFVIGMSDAIDDASAVAFSMAFYEALAAGRDIPTAFRLGQNAIDLENLTGELVPILIETPRRKTGTATPAPIGTAKPQKHSDSDSKTKIEPPPVELARYRGNDRHIQVSKKPEVAATVAEMFKDFISEYDDRRKIKEFVAAHPELLDAIPQMRGGRPMIENLLDFDRDPPTRGVPGGIGPDFTRFVFQPRLSQIRNQIIFVQFLSPKAHPFEKDMQLAKVVTKARDMIWDRISEAGTRYEKFVDEAVKRDDFEIGKSDLMNGNLPNLQGAIVVGRRKYLSEEQIIYLSASKDVSEVKIMTYDTLIEACDAESAS